MNHSVYHHHVPCSSLGLSPRLISLATLSLGDINFSKSDNQAKWKKFCSSLRNGDEGFCTYANCSCRWGDNTASCMVISTFVRPVPQQNTTHLCISYSPVSSGIITFSDTNLVLFPWLRYYTPPEPSGSAVNHPVLGLMSDEDSHSSQDR